MTGLVCSKVYGVTGRCLSLDIGWTPASCSLHDSVYFPWGKEQLKTPLTSTNTAAFEYATSENLQSEKFTICHRQEILSKLNSVKSAKS
jgi:hypothetical protein